MLASDTPRAYLEVTLARKGSHKSDRASHPFQRPLQCSSTFAERQEGLCPFGHQANIIFDILNRENMKKTLFLAFALGICASAMAQKALPDVTFRTLYGETVAAKDLVKDSKIVVLSFWATWCSPCKKELDAMADLYPEWQEKYNVEVVAVTIDNQRALAKVPSMVTTKGWEYTILHGEENKIRNAFNFQTIPYTLLIAPDGTIAWTHNGYVPGDEYELEEKIAELARK
ncbi:MAG: TlpA family protein disulfide reductase [Bacteroidetes bacterium]|nr:MAG: TlpA family protein disulfide reductase [Bacteroidota bacterium]